MPHMHKRGCNHRATSRKHKGSQRQGTEKVSGRSGLSYGATHPQKSGLPPGGHSQGNPRLAKARASCGQAPRTPFFGRLGPRHFLLVPVLAFSAYLARASRSTRAPGVRPSPWPKGQGASTNLTPPSLLLLKSANPAAAVSTAPASSANAGTDWITTCAGALFFRCRLVGMYVNQ